VGKLIAILAIVIIVIAVFVIYAGITYPRVTANTQVSFTVGADKRTIAFEQPLLDDKAQIQVTIETGAALWQAQILNGNQIIWEHSAAQGEQQSYNSGWISLPIGNYNFTFGTLGIGSLDATAMITSKGGFW